ncbi:hypothetical protein AcV7_000323 [Taiwanofungus camphoratus]|nr:hypothetical protein AcV7_000323 [Antrodia cinnamomea]
MAHKISPNRRRSIAVLSQGPSSRHGNNRRRAYSIVPGEKLSPAAKARRLLAPRKSILKASLNLPDSTESSALADETNTTQSMDFTEMHPSGPRKSLGRRVSFASHAHVRLFEIQEQNTNSTAEPPSSPSQESSPQINNENTHPDTVPARRRSSVRRRSSTAFSEYGEQSMDMDIDDTAPLPNDFLRQQGYQDGGSAIDDDEFTDDEDDEDMEITEAIRLNIERKRSLSLGQGRASIARRRSSIAPTTSSQGQSENRIPPQDYRPPLGNEQRVQDLEHGQDQDLTTSSTQSQSSFTSEGSSGENTQPMEFTIPISRSLRPPEPPSDAWLKLRAMTHAGDEPYEPPPPEGSDDEEMDAIIDHGGTPGRSQDAMELTDAMQRLLSARTSLGLPPMSAPLAQPDFPQAGFDTDNGDALGLQEQQLQEDSFTSTEDSFTGDADAGDRTMNVTSLIRASLGTVDSSMDATSIYGGIREKEAVVNVPLGPPPEAPAGSSSALSANAKPSPPSVFSAPQPAKPGVFSALAPKTPALPSSPAKPPASATIPKPFTFSLPRLPSPTKNPFASPMPSTSSMLQSPVVQAQARRGTAAFAPPSARKSPLKRPVPPDADGEQDRPSPAKRITVGKLEPAKKAPFERAQPSELQGNRRASAVRRPSGYFAQRKSLGAGVLVPNVSGHAAEQRPGGAKKIAGPGLGLGRGRASVGSAPSGDGLGSDPLRSGAAGSLYPDVNRIIQEDPPTPSPAMNPEQGPMKACERETSRQAIATPSPTRGSPAPAPAPSRSNSPTPGIVKPNILRRLASPASIVPHPPRHPIATSAPEPILTSTGINLPRPPEHADIRMAAPAETRSTSADPSATQQWREGVQEDVLDDDEGPPISIEQFFTMTGIRFMDELTMPKPRQSTVAPIQLRSRARRRSSTDSGTDVEEESIPLAEFSVAMAVEVPRLELYTAVTNDLTAWIEDSKNICLQAERETEKVTPELFRDFVAADDSEKSLLLHQLKLIKANNYGTAKSQWYDWKTDWVERLYGRAEYEFANLEADAQILAKIIKEAQDILPTLRGEYEQVISELEQEQADIAEIENSDQDYLNELKTSIAEQNIELETFRADVSESRAKLQRLEEKLAEIESQKQEVSVAIAQAQHIAHIQQESTSAEVFRLKDELEALQELHLWRVAKITSGVVEVIYASRYQVSIPCIKYKPSLVKANVCRTKNARTRERDPFPQFTDLALQTARQLIIESSQETNIQKIMERLGDFWSSCAQVRSQLCFLAVKYPLSVEAVQNTKTASTELRARVTVLFPAMKGKAYISFILDLQTYSTWPISINSLRSEVEIAYGLIDQRNILNAVRSRLAQANYADNHGCLLDACIEATEQCE